MMSIIICSRSQHFFEKLQQNIQVSIGIDYEIIKIDNVNNHYTLCQAYNVGANQAKYDYLLFLHEDVEFITNNWGATLLALFEKEEHLGLIGIAGSKLKSTFPSGWTSFAGEADCFRVHHYAHSSAAPVLQQVNPFNEVLSEVIVIDGVFMAMRKAVWQTIKFDETLPGFHFYDLDFSLRTTLEGWRVAVWLQLDLIHFSRGNFGDEWLKNAILYHRRKAKLLGAINDKYPFPAEELKSAKLKWLHRLRAEKISLKNKIKYLLSLGIHLEYTFLKAAARFLKN